MREGLSHEESVVVFNAQKDLLHKQVLLKEGYSFKKVKCHVRERNDLDKVFHRWTSKKPLNRYYTEGRNIVQRNVLDEISPYTVPATSWYRQSDVLKSEPLESGRKHYEKPTQRGRNNADLLNRVCIPPDPKPLPIGICDFNPDFFTLVKGRETSTKFNKREYLDTLRTTLQQNVQAAVYKDFTKFIHQQFLLDFKAISSRYNSLYDTEEILKAFSFYDETETLKVKNIKKMFWKEYSESLEMIESVKRKTSLILNDLQYTWDRLLSRIHCKKLLYEISPPSWKRWYDQQKQAWKPEDMESYNTLNEQYKEYLTAVGQPDPEVAKLMQDCKTLFESIGPNLIYYSHMSQVEEVFKDLEGQAALALEYTAIISGHREKLLKVLEETDKYNSHRKKMLDGLIDMLGNKIKDNHNRANELEDRINAKAELWFKDIIVGEETMLVKSLIQVMFEEIVGQRNKTMTNKEMLEELEMKMIKLKTDMGQIGHEEKREMTQNLKKKEEEALAKAGEAKSRETALKKLIKQMETSMKDYPVTKTWKQLRPRSPPPTVSSKSHHEYRQAKISFSNENKEDCESDSQTDLPIDNIDSPKKSRKSSVGLNDI